MSGVTVTRDEVAGTFKRIEKLLGAQVLVGIPESTADREETSQITNAGAAYINEFGSPAVNIPPRPFLIPGVEAAQPKALYQLKMAVREALNGSKTKAQARLARAGVVAVQSVRDHLINGDFVPLSPHTVRNRWRKRNGTKGQSGSMRPEEKRYLALIANGMAPAEAQSDAGIKPLINTAQMLNSITYVVRQR